MGGGLGCSSVCSWLLHVSTCNKWVARKQKSQTFTSTSFIVSFSAHVCFPPSWSIINASDARPPCPLHTQPVLHPSHPSSPPEIIQPSPIRHPSPYFELFTLSGIRCLFHWCNSAGYTTLWNLLCQASPACLMIFLSLSVEKIFRRYNFRMSFLLRRFTGFSFWGFVLGACKDSNLGLTLLWQILTAVVKLYLGSPPLS